MITQLRSAATLVAVFTLMLGLAYPLAMTGFAGAVFPEQAAGSLVERDGRIVGSALVGQAFSGPGYLHPRPSAAGGGTVSSPPPRLRARAMATPTPTAARAPTPITTRRSEKTLMPAELRPRVRCCKLGRSPRDGPGGGVDREPGRFHSRRQA